MRMKPGEQLYHQLCTECGKKTTRCRCAEVAGVHVADNRRKRPPWQTEPVWTVAEVEEAVTAVAREAELEWPQDYGRRVGERLLDKAAPPQASGRAARPHTRLGGESGRKLA